MQKWRLAACVAAALVSAGMARAGDSDAPCDARPLTMMRAQVEVAPGNTTPVVLTRSCDGAREQLRPRSVSGLYPGDRLDFGSANVRIWLHELHPSERRVLRSDSGQALSYGVPPESAQSPSPDWETLTRRLVGDLVGQVPPGWRQDRPIHRLSMERRRALQAKPAATGYEAQAFPDAEADPAIRMIRRQGSAAPVFDWLSDEGYLLAPGRREIALVAGVMMDRAGFTGPVCRSINCSRSSVVDGLPAAWIDVPPGVEGLTVRPFGRSVRHVRLRHAAEEPPVPAGLPAPTIGDAAEGVAHAIWLVLEGPPAWRIEGLSRLMEWAEESYVAARVFEALAVGEISPRDRTDASR